MANCPFVKLKFSSPGHANILPSRSSQNPQVTRQGSYVGLLQKYPELCLSMRAVVNWVSCSSSCFIVKISILF